MDIPTLDPVSNTGSECQTVSQGYKINTVMTVGVDWIQCVFGFSSTPDLKNKIAYIEGLFNDSFEIFLDTPVTHGKRWHNSGKSVRGSAIAFDIAHRNDCKKSRCWLSLCATTLRQSSFEAIAKLISTLIAWKAKFTRIDVCIDDYSKTLSPQQIMEAYESKNVARFDYFDPRFPRRLNQEDCGWTLYMGSPSSSKRVRYYNKSVQSKGEIDAYRMEVQYRDDYSNTIANELSKISSDNVELIARFLSGLVLGAIDFVDRSMADRLSRCDRLPWWADFIDRVGQAIRIATQRPTSTIQKTMEWMSSQVETSLAMIHQYFNSDAAFLRYIGDRITSGKNRFTHRHCKLLELAE